MNYSRTLARRRRRRFAFKRIWHRHSKLLLLLTITVLVFTVIAVLPVAAQSTESDLIPKTTYFSQDFSGSSVVADYVSATPSSGQFNSIGTAGAGMVISINSGTLQYTRTTNSGSFSRTADFVPTPTTLKYSFDLTVSGNTAAQTTAAIFQIGSSFGTGNSAEVNANVFSRFGVNWTVNTAEWSLRNIAASSNSANFTGTQTVTWFINNSDSGREYLAPDGTTETLADNSADLWIGTTKVFDDFAATTPTQLLTDIKFVFTAGAGTIQIDNIQIEDIAAPTAAAVSLAGRVVDPFGNPVRDAIILLEGSLLDRPRAIRVSSFGYYRFDGLHVGTYNVTVSSRRAFFVNPTRTVTLHDSVKDVDFVADGSQ